MTSFDLRQGSCPICGHNEIIESFPRTVTVEFKNANIERTPRLALTHALFEGESGGKDFDPRRPRGALTAFTCRQCGFTQLFAQHPEMVPIGPDYYTRLLTGPGGEGPYR